MHCMNLHDLLGNHKKGSILMHDCQENIKCVLSFPKKLAPDKYCYRLR